MSQLKLCVTLQNSGFEKESVSEKINIYEYILMVTQQEKPQICQCKAVLEKYTKV